MSKTFLQLQTQIAQLQKEAESLRKKEAADVLARIKEAISVYGFTAQDLGVATTRKLGRPASKVGGKAGKKVAAEGPKFKDDQGNVWSGRGPRPQWFKAALASGKTPEQLSA